MSVRILHTSDVHLGATFKMLGARGREQHKQLQQTFANVVSLAIQERVDVVLIAGDLFDSVAAARTEAGFAGAQFERLGAADIPICAIAGNHDPLDEGSAGLWRDLEARHPHLRVFGPDLEVRTLRERDVTIVGRSAAHRVSARSPLTGPSARAGGVPAPRTTKYLVGVFHGSVQRPDFESKFGLITPEEIAASGLDYLALGDWHSALDVSSGGVTAWYSGAPEMIDVDESASGNVLLVTLRAPGRAEVERRRVGRRRAARLDLDLVTAGGAAGVERAIRERADTDLALQVTLSGLVAVGERFDVARLREDLRSEFFRLEIRDASQVRADDADLAEYPEGTMLGRFVRRMRDEIAARQGEERTVAEDALAYGVALLQGRTGVLG